MHNFSLSSRKFPIKTNKTQEKFKCNYRNSFRCPLHWGKVIKSEHYYILWCMQTSAHRSQTLEICRHIHLPSSSCRLLALHQSLKLYKFIVINGSVWLALSRGIFYQLLPSAQLCKVRGFLIASFLWTFSSYTETKLHKITQNYSWRFCCKLLYGPCIYFLWCKINFMDHLLSVQSV